MSLQVLFCFAFEIKNLNYFLQEYIWTFSYSDNICDILTSLKLDCPRFPALSYLGAETVEQMQSKQLKNLFCASVVIFQFLLLKLSQHTYICILFTGSISYSLVFKSCDSSSITKQVIFLTSLPPLVQSFAVNTHSLQTSQEFKFLGTLLSCELEPQRYYIGSSVISLLQQKYNNILNIFCYSSLLLKAM